MDRPPIWKADAAARARNAEARRHHPWAGVLARLSAVPRLRERALRLCARLEGGPMFSATLRDVLRDRYGVEIGRYSYGDILRPGLLPPGTRVGAWCSVGSGLIVRRRDHPLDRPSLHPFFYNSGLGFLERDTIPSEQDNPLTIGHDVWIGDRVTILGGCRSIGNGAVLAAGAVVTHDVEAYSVVGGVPARRIRMRFSAEKAARIEESRWWECSLATLVDNPPWPGAGFVDSGSS